jgi:hypothetical protein
MIIKSRQIVETVLKITCYEVKLDNKSVFLTDKESVDKLVEAFKSPQYIAGQYIGEVEFEIPVKQ